MKWETVKLSDVSQIGDGAHASLKRVESGIPYLTAKNITKSGIDYTTLIYISEETYQKHFKESSNALTCPKEDDILYSIIGSIGGVYRVQNEVLGISSSVAIFRPKQELVLSDYLTYYLKSSFFDVQVNAIKGGVAQAFLSLSKLGSISITIPKSIEYQQKIVGILSAYDDLIENNQKQIMLLEEAAQRLYKEWFVDLRFPGHEHTAIVDGVPEGWRYESLSNIIKYVRGKSYTTKDLSNSDGIIMVNLKNIKSFGGYNRNAEKRFSGKVKNEQILFPGDIVMGVTDMTSERRLVGHVALVPDLKEKMTFSMDLIKIIPIETSKNYLYSTFYYGGFSKIISPLANGVNVLHLKPDSIMSLQMLIPSKETQRIYDYYFTEIIKKIELLQTQSDIATQARDRLLPKLMSGEMEV